MQWRKPQESSRAESKLIMTHQIALMSFCFASGCEAETEENTDMAPYVRKHILTRETFPDFVTLSFMTSF